MRDRDRDGELSRQRQRTAAKEDVHSEQSDRGRPAWQACR